VSALENVYGSIFITRPPVPATVNKAGANYKSEVRHLEYSPRAAYDEWLAINEGILALGGDAIFDFEAADDPFLDRGPLEVTPDGTITPAGSKERLGHLDTIDTGRVFCANGPWVIVRDGNLLAMMPNMLAHRRQELPYYKGLLTQMAKAAGLGLEIVDCPDRWEGMADVAVVGDKVVFTYTVPGHYDEGVGNKSMRSTLFGVTAAADFAHVPKEARIFAELVYPHFHGDTVHFGARPKSGAPKLVHYAGGLWRDEAAKVKERLAPDAIVPIDRHDAVDAYAGNSRQVAGGVLIPDGVSPKFIASLEALGLPVKSVALLELFGKAGGGPACATLYLPSNLDLPANFDRRYSVRRAEAKQRRERIAEKLTVHPDFFATKTRG
jgi:hypothetical protein